MQKKAVIITTTQPSVNPRLVKEADALAAAGYAITVLYCFVIEWANETDKTILNKAGWSYQKLGGKNKASFKYKYTALRFAFFKKLYRYFGPGNGFAERSICRCYRELLNAAVKIKADVYIGHNPGALAVTANAAITTRRSAVFDFEDYHRGEYTDPHSEEVKRQIYLEEKYIRHFTGFSAASPLIAEYVKRDLPGISAPIVTILNTFTKQDQPQFRVSDEADDTLKLFWFSQHLGTNRGLGMLVTALKELNDPNIFLTLAGNCSTELHEHFKELAGDHININFPGIIPPDQLAEFASKFDIGMALEPAFSINNNIALSNKIFTYLLAGNAIIFSETFMQKRFNDEYKTGMSFPLHDKEALKQCILFYKNKNELNRQRQNNYMLAKEKLNWEIESQKLLQVTE